MSKRLALLALALTLVLSAGRARAVEKGVPELPRVPGGPSAAIPAVPALPAPAALEPDAYVPALPATSIEAVHQAQLATVHPAAPGAVASPAGAVAAARASVADQLSAMRAVVGPEHHALLEDIGRSAAALLDQVDEHVKAGAIDPTTADIRVHEHDDFKPVVDRELRVGVYPVAADPFHWGHVLVGLQAIARLKLDKVVFVLAGDDPRKPTMTKVDVRHPMGRAVLDAFAPFFAYSPIAVGTSYDGETNIFRLLALNPGQAMKAFYLVGDDHYRLLDKKGNPDTLPKIEANMRKPELVFDPSVHSVGVRFIEREGRSGEPVPTTISDVDFLPHVGFEASSTDIRNGKLALMPHAAYKHVKDGGHQLYGIE